jgi:hypothetical protein
MSVAACGGEAGVTQHNDRGRYEVEIYSEGF